RHAHLRQSDRDGNRASRRRGGGMDQCIGRAASPRHQTEGRRNQRRTAVRDKTPATVRVMTWNIHGAAGGNPRFDLAGVVELIQRWDADIIALQEVDSRRERIRDDPFEVLQDALGKHGMCAKSITTSDGDYGQMLISRWPIVNSEVNDISFPEREPRRAVR